MTLKINIETAKVVEFIKFDIVMVTGVHNRGCIGVIQHRKKHKGSFDAIHVVDAAGRELSPVLHFPKARVSSFLLWMRPRSGLL
jgi:ribosomal protein S4E